LAKLSLPVPRIQSNYIQFNKANYKERKKLYELKLKEMLNYSVSKNKCRSQLILAYFEEKNAHECGTCDVCRAKKQYSAEKETSWKFMLNNKLQNEPVYLVELVNLVELHEQQQFKDFIRMMLDQNQLELLEDGRIKRAN
jgi:ATP-dependent DNA helicase RecQ